MELFKDFSFSNPFCSKCKLHQGTEYPLLYGRGDINSKVLVICDAPTTNDSLLGVPFSASFGTSIERDLRNAGFENYMLAYMVKCFPNGKKLATANACCYPLTMEIIQAMKPKVIIALGAPVLAHLTKVALSEETARQKAFYHPELDTTIICTFNPKRYWGNNSDLTTAWFLEDLKFAYSEYKKPPIRKINSVPRTITNSKDVKEYLEHLLTVDVFAFDIETAVTDPIPLDLNKVIKKQLKEQGLEVDEDKDYVAEFSKYVDLDHKSDDEGDEENSEESENEESEAMQDDFEQDYGEFRDKAKAKAKKGDESHNPRKDSITDISFCAKVGQGVHISWEYILENFDLFKQVMASDVKKVVQHGVYDVEFLMCIGVTVNNVNFDTENAYHTLTATYEGGKAKGLYRLKTMNWFLTTTGGYNDVLEDFGGISGYQKLKQKLLESTEAVLHVEGSDAPPVKKRKSKKAKEEEAATPPMTPEEAEKSRVWSGKLEVNANIVKDKKMERIKELNLSEGEYYSAMDSDVTLRISQRLRPLIDKDYSFVFYNSRSPLVSSLAKMRARGVRFDVPHMLRVKEYNFRKAYEERQKFFDAVGYKFNLASVPQLQKAMFKDLGIKPNPKYKTKTGFSTNAEAIGFYAKESKVLKHILNYRTFLKANSAYIDGFLKYMDPITHRIHASGLQTSAATGRLSFVRPAVQTIPRSNLYRNAIIPPPGWKLVSSDLSQAELRFVAMLANDKVMLEAFASGFDLHKFTACKMLLGIDISQYDSNNSAHTKARTIAKSINFGIVYGVTAFALTDQVNTSLYNSYIEALEKGISVEPPEEITVEDAQRFINQWLSTYQGVADWIERTKKFAYDNGYVKTLFGRIRYLPNVRSYDKGVAEADLRKAINTPVQGGANEIALLGLNKMNKHLDKYKMRSGAILIIHDEIVMETHPEELDEVRGVLTEVLTKDIPYVTVPFVADTHVYDRWQK